jgi:hypothetical protein
MAQRSISTRGWVLFAAMCVIWGIPYLMIRVAVREVSPSALVLFRTAIAALILLPLAVRRGELAPLRHRLLPLAVFAGVEIAVPWIALGSAEQRLSSVTGAASAATMDANPAETKADGMSNRPTPSSGRARFVRCSDCQPAPFQRHRRRQVFEHGGESASSEGA